MGPPPDWKICKGPILWDHTYAYVCTFPPPPARSQTQSRPQMVSSDPNGIKMWMNRNSKVQIQNSTLSTPEKWLNWSNTAKHLWSGFITPMNNKVLLWSIDCPNNMLQLFKVPLVRSCLYQIRRKGSKGNIKLSPLFSTGGDTTPKKNEKWLISATHDPSAFYEFIWNVKHVILLTKHFKYFNMLLYEEVC